MMLSTNLCILVGLFAAFDLSAALTDEDHIGYLQKLDQILLEKLHMNPKGSLLETHATFNKLASRLSGFFKQEHEYNVRNRVLDLEAIWQVEALDCESDRQLRNPFEYHSIAKLYADRLSKALGDYVVFVYQRAVEHCTRKLSANKWKQFLQSVPQYGAKSFGYERSRALRLMRYSVDGTEPDDVMLNKMADRVREFKKKSWFDDNLAAVFMDVGRHYDELLLSMNYQIPEDAPDDVRKLYLLWLVWSKVDQVNLKDFFSSKSATALEALKVAAESTSVESGLARYSTTFQSTQEEARKILAKACGSLDKKMAAVLNLMEALELYTDQTKAAIFCFKFNSARA